MREGPANVACDVSIIMCFGVRGGVQGGGFEGIAFLYGKFRNLVVQF